MTNAPEPLSPMAAAQRVGVPDGALPKAVAIIMDGNGRWATEQGLSRSEGHIEGAKRVRGIVTEAAQLGLSALTLYSFSTENWNRPPEEVEVLMHLYAAYLEQECPTMVANNIRLRHLGSRMGLPDEVLAKIDLCLDATADNTGMDLCLALNYGSRLEILEGVRTIARQVQAGLLAPDRIDEATIASALYTAGVTDPDLLIRTSGELRISNFLLWQISYAEFVSTPLHWPEFTVDIFHDCLRTFAARKRRFGGLDKSTEPSRS
jgi:undecaprenyl diphosphate synthase